MTGITWWRPLAKKRASKRRWDYVFFMVNEQYAKMVVKPQKIDVLKMFLRLGLVLLLSTLFQGVLVLISV